MPRPRKPKPPAPVEIQEPDHKQVARILDHWHEPSKGPRSRFLMKDGSLVDRQWDDTLTSSTWWRMPNEEQEG